MRKERRKTNIWKVAAVVAIVLSLNQVVVGAPRYKVLHYFSGTDGVGPYGGVTADQEGNLYGASDSGGSGGCDGYGFGLIFELKRGEDGVWAETILHTFGSVGDGSVPYGSLTLDSAGNVYGTTTTGGAYNYGTVFELTDRSGGWAEKLLYSFKYLSQPGAKLAMDKEGNIYGVTPKDSDAYELMRGFNRWKESVLHNFTGNHGDGYDPYAGMILDAAGNLYGTTQNGGHPVWQFKLRYGLPTEPTGWGRVERNCPAPL